MSFEEALSDIKSYDFAARVGIASDLRTFLRAAEQEESVQTIVALMVSEQNQLRVLKEVLALSGASVDHRYENPQDAALGVLVWALNRMAPQVARVAAQRAAEAPQAWWAWKVGDSVLRGAQASEGAGNAALLSGLTYDAKDVNIDQKMLRGTLVGALHATAGVQVYHFSQHMDLPGWKVARQTLRGDGLQYISVISNESTVTALEGTLAR